jgi:hypothetical protein
MSIADREQYDRRADYYCPQCGHPFDGALACTCDDDHLWEGE